MSDQGAADNSVPSATLNWHVLYTKPHCETQVEAELTEEGMQVYLPVLPAAAPRRGRPAFRPFFPCYLFARFDLEAVGISHINWTRGMRHLVMFGGKAALVDDAVVESIREHLAQEYVMDREGGVLKHGDHVLLRTPAKEIEAVFDKRLSASGRVQVLVECLQRWTVDSVDLVKIPEPRKRRFAGV